MRGPAAPRTGHTSRRLPSTEGTHAPVGPGIAPVPQPVSHVTARAAGPRPGRPRRRAASRAWPPRGPARCARNSERELHAGAHPEQRGPERGDLHLRDQPRARRPGHARAAQGDAGEEPEHEQRHDRRPLAAPSPPAAIRRRTLTAATTGASSSTRVSLTTTAMATTAAPPAPGRRDDLADLLDAGPGPDAELHVAEPQRVPASSGSSTIASGPEQGDHRDPDGDVLLVGAGGVLHRRDRRGAADGEAGADQQAACRAELRPGCPSHVVTTSVVTRVPATRPIVPSPSAAIAPNETENPSRTIPIRSSRLVTRPSACFAARGQQPGVAGDHARERPPR